MTIQGIACIKYIVMHFGHNIKHLDRFFVSPDPKWNSLVPTLFLNYCIGKIQYFGWQLVTNN